MIKLYDTEQSTASLLQAFAVIELQVRWAVKRAQANDLEPDNSLRGLYISDEKVSQLLDCRLGAPVWAMDEPVDYQALDSDGALIKEQWDLWWACLGSADNVDRLRQLVMQFGLSSLETQSFLLAVAPAIDPRYEQLYAYLQDDVTKKRPFVNLLLNLLTDDFAEEVALRRCFGENGRLAQSNLLEIQPADTPLPTDTPDP